MMRGHALSLVLGCAALACGSPAPPQASAGPSGEPEQAKQVPVAPTGEAAVPALQCPHNDHFANLDWVPPSRFALQLNLRDPRADAALKACPQFDEDLGLPVYAGFELKQLPFSAATVRMLARQLTLDPTELVALHDAQGHSLWVAPANCDLEALETLASRTFPLRFRRAPNGRLGVPSGESPAAKAFAFDLLLSDTGLLVFAPRGSGNAVARWLQGGGTNLGELTKVRAGEGLAKLPAAALRMRLEGAAIAGVGSGTARGFVLAHAAPTAANPQAPLAWRPVVDSGP